MMDFLNSNSSVRNNSVQTIKDWAALLDQPLQWVWDLRIGREDFVRSPLFPVGISVGFYFILCSIYMLADTLLKDVQMLKKYKIQSDKAVTHAMIRQAISRTLMNNFFLIVPSSIAQVIWVPPTPLMEKAPGFWEFFYQLWLMMILFDFQYWIWHAIHHKNRWLYRTFHAIHHHYHSTFCWTTQYLHPWELFTVGFFATVDGWFFECHPLTTWSFMLLNIFFSIEAHCGFDFPLSMSKVIPFGFYGGAPKHDMHHMRPLTNFQPFFSSWDRLMGWDCPGIGAQNFKSDKLKAWEEKNRNKRLNKHACLLMEGTENGLLRPVNSDLEEENLTKTQTIHTKAD